MKKTLLVSLILLSGILLTGCGKKDDVVINEEEVVNINCQKAVNKYLDGADKKGKGDEIKSGDNIVVDYIGRLENGTVFDTSIKSIAKECEINNNESLSFEVGTPGLIQGFNEGIIGMKVGQTKTVKFGFEKGYGPYDETLLATYSLDEVGDLSGFKKGDTVQFDNGFYARISDINDKEVTFDFNHELAGRDLIFDITVKSIN